MMDTLRDLESGYFDQPLMGQREDLKRINELRQELGLPLVDSRLKPVEQPKAKKVKDLTKAREIYAAFKVKAAELKKYQEYAQKIVEATDGLGMTPVEPLATMGCGGGPLLCDHCKKPIILEGGRFEGMYADKAWAMQSPTMRINWKSYIKGGMVVELQSNATLRIYHGYQHVETHCCQLALREDEKKRKAHKFDLDKKLQDEILEVIEEVDKYRVYNQLVNLMFGYDPGFGVNCP